MKKSPGINTKKIFSWLIVILPITILIYAFATRANAPAKKRAEKGFMDLQAWNFEKDGNIRLDGEWEIYWNKLLDPGDFKNSDTIPSDLVQIPNIWNGQKFNGQEVSGNGFATFRLKVKIKNPEKLYALKIITMSNAYKLWVNNELVAKNGVVGQNKNTSIPEYKPQVVAFYPDSSVVQFVVQVSNYHHWKGGIWHPIKFGEYPSVQKERDIRIVLEIFLFGCLFIMALYHFGLFSLRKIDVSTLFFGLMCLSIGVRSLFTGENLVTIIFPNLDWFISRKIEFLLTFTSIPIYSAFSRSLYPKEWPKYLYWTIMSIGIGLCLFVLFTPVGIYTFTSYIFTFFSSISSLIIIFVFTKAVIRKREGADLFLTTSLFLLLTMVNEILNQTEVVHTGLYLPVGLFIVVFAQSFILSTRSAHAFRTTEIYARTFQKFVPKQFLKRVAKEGIESIKPGNAEKGEITVLFSDIRSFTTLSEKMSPDEVFNMLNEYLSYVEPPIRAHHGFVDKYMGDGIMALFEKEGDQSSAYNTITAALEMQDSLRRYNHLRKEASKPALEMGIGIHTGQVIIGTLGGNERMDSTAIGDAVNLCSRIEGMTKVYGVEILVSGPSIGILDNKSTFLFRFIDYVIAKGKTEPVSIWEVMGKRSEAGMDKKVLLEAEYESSIKKYRDKMYAEAILGFKKCLEIEPNDKVSAIYIKRCEEALKGGSGAGASNITTLDFK